MNKKSKYTLIVFFTLLSLGAGEILYLNYSKSMSSSALHQKQTFVSLSGLPDLAFGSENSYIRHRSLSNIFDIYAKDGSLREESKMSFSTTSKIEKEL